VAEIKKVRIRRERASFPAAALAFLLFSIVLFLAAESVKEESAVSKIMPAGRREVREIEIPDIRLFLVALSDDETENACLASARYMPRGAAGYLFRKDGKMHSIGNMYFSKEEAEKMAKHISSAGITASVIPLIQKGVTLRVTAQEESAAALDFCVNAFHEFEKSLAKYSGQLDSGMISLKEARVLLSVLHYDLSEKKTQAEEALFALGENAAGEIFDMYLESLETLSSLTKNEGGEMMLSARIKYSMIDFALKRADLLKRLNA